MTLYADYQVQASEDRAELDGKEQFWKDWIAPLETKKGSAEARLLQEVVLHEEGAEGFVRLADKNYKVHPSLYLAVMKEYEHIHDYGKIEEIGEQALEKIEKKLVVRSETALKAAYASDCLQHREKMMRFCWESFLSEPTVRNFLRLFGIC